MPYVSSLLAAIQYGPSGIGASKRLSIGRPGFVGRGSRSPVSSSHVDPAPCCVHLCPVK